MNLNGVTAYGAQLAELLVGVLKLDRHITTTPGDLQELLAAAKCVIAADVPSESRARHVDQIAAPNSPALAPGRAASYVHAVPDHCDRVTWRGDYITLRKSRDDMAPTPVFVVEMDGSTVLRRAGRRRHTSSTSTATPKVATTTKLCMCLAKTTTSSNTRLKLARGAPF